MKTVIKIKGTHCESCKKLLEDVIGEVQGVKSVKVDFKTGKTEIEHEGKLDMKTLKKEVASLKLYQIE